MSSWATGYCAQLDVVNNGTATVTSWDADLNFPGAKLTQVWNGTGAATDTLLTLKPANYNQKITPATTVNIGYCAQVTASEHTPTVAEVRVTD